MSKQLIAHKFYALRKIMTMLLIQTNESTTCTTIKQTYYYHRTTISQSNNNHTTIIPQSNKSHITTISLSYYNQITNIPLSSKV